MEAFVNFLALVFVRGCLFAILSVELTDAALETASRIVAKFYRNIVLRLFSAGKVFNSREVLADGRYEIAAAHVWTVFRSFVLFYFLAECHTLRS